jgi:CBS domain-containing protein
MYQVKNAMSTEVVSLRPEATIDAAIRILLQHNVSGAPVMDGDGKLVGIISQFQMIEVIYDPEVKNLRVRDLMTRNVLTVEDDALLGMAANMLIVHRIHRLPVMRDGNVVGIISRSDLLRYSIKTGEKIEAFFAKLKNMPAQNQQPVAAV